VVAHRVANAIEAIAIYEMTTNMARKSMIQTERQEDKVVEDSDTKNEWTCTRKENLMKTLSLRRLTSTPKERPSCIT
ncbi:hypothetical protein Tco_0094708, partial [Tanacetum coccineum]